MKIQEIRNFNRYYSRILGVFDQNVFDLDYSMVEMRILGEINRHPGTTANALSKFLVMDKGYLSRLVSKMENADFLYKVRDDLDHRVFHLYLTERGQELNQYVDMASDQKVTSLFSGLAPYELDELIISMNNIEKLLEKTMAIEMED